MNLGLILPPTIRESTTSNNAGATAEGNMWGTSDSGNDAVPWVFLVIGRSTIRGFPCGILTSEL